MRFHCLVAAATALGALTLGMTTAAQATTSYTLGGGPGFDFQSTNVTFTDPSASPQPLITCSQADMTGSISAGTGYIASASFSGCTNGILGGAVAVVALFPSGDWTLSVDGDATGSTWPASLNGLAVAISLPGCQFTAGDGNGGGADISGTFDTSNQTFAPTPNGLNSDLEINNGTLSGTTCGLAGMSDYDSIVMGSTWINTPPPGSTALTITNP